MSQVNKLVQEIETLQNQTNDAIIKKETALAKKESILKDIDELKAKSIEEFGCDIEKLECKKQEYSDEIRKNINNLKRVLGIE